MHELTEISKSGFEHGHQVVFTDVRFCGFTPMREGGFVFLMFGVKTHCRIHGFLCVSRRCRVALSCCASSHPGCLAPFGLPSLTSARFACPPGGRLSARPRRATLGAPISPPNRGRLIGPRSRPWIRDCLDQHPVVGVHGGALLVDLAASQSDRQRSLAHAAQPSTPSPHRPSRGCDGRAMRVRLNRSAPIGSVH